MIRKENTEIDYSERSARALHNGKYCEELIREKVPELVESETVDGELFGLCQLRE